MFFCFLQLKNDGSSKPVLVVLGLFFPKNLMPVYVGMTFGSEMAFRHSCGAHFQKSCPMPIYGPCKLLLWLQWRVQFSTFRKLPYRNVRAVAVKRTLFKNCSCYQLEKSSHSSSGVRKVPVARLPCLLFGPPPPAAPVIWAQAPSRPWPPRSSLTQASGSSSLC